MVPSIVGLLLWPRRWRQNEKKLGKDIQSHRVSTASSSSSDEDVDVPPETPAKKSFKKCFTRRPSSKLKEIKEPELQLVCYLCGQHFQRSRLLDHVPDCLKAWNRREEIKPKKERARLPVRPVELDQELPTTFETAEMFNKLMRCAWLAAINRRCEFCKKTFKCGNALIACLFKKCDRLEHRDSVDDVLQRQASDVVSRKPQRMRRRSQDGSKPPFLHSMEDPARLLKRAEALRTAPVYGAESLDDSPRRFSIYHTIDLPQREKPTTVASSKTLHPVKRDADAVKRAERSRSFTGSRPLPVDHSKDPPLPKYKPYHSCQEENRHGRRPAAPSPTVDMIPARRRSSVRTVTLIKEACVQEIPSRQPEVHKSDPSGRRHGVHSFKESVTATHHDSHRTLKKSQSSNRATVAAATHSFAPSAELPPITHRSRETHALKEKENTSTLAAKTTSSTRKYMRRWSISEIEPSKEAKTEHRDGKRSLDKSISMTTRGPRGYTCYLCGRQFGSASLGIHLRQCRQLWEDQEALKQRKRDRRPPPTPPPELDDPLPTEREAIDAFNSKMLEIYEKRSLMGCPHCGRTFTEEAFEKHQRVCTAANPGGPLGPSKYHQPAAIAMNASSSSKPKASVVVDMRPAQYCCYLCGRQYGSQSLFLHVPRCQKLWIDREATKPKKERRSLPSPPPEYEGFPHLTLPTDPEAVLEFNNAVYMYWDRHSLFVCTKCGRSFNEESYAKHQRLCQGTGSMKRTGQSKKQPSRDDPKDSRESSDYDASSAPSTDRHSLGHLSGEKHEINSVLARELRGDKRWLREEEHREQRRYVPVRSEQRVPYYLDDVERDAASSSSALRF